MVSHTYPSSVAGTSEEAEAAGSPLGNRQATTADGYARTTAKVALVEDRLTGDRRNLPAPPSHRSRTAANEGSVQTQPRPAARATTRLSPLALDERTSTTPDETGPITSVLPTGYGSSLGESPTDFDLAADRVRDPYDDPAIGKLSLSRRIMRGGLVVGLIGAVAALMFAMPDDDGAATVETASAAESDSPLPVATAEMLDDASRASVDVSLGASDSLASMTVARFASRTGSPADTPSGFDAVVTEVVEEAIAPSTTTTTVWVEPAIPPASDWVDSGNGVAVPDVLLRIRFCESTNNYDAANGSSSARGAFQFLTKSWKWYGHAEVTGVEQAHLATPAQQDEAALRTLQSQGTGPWAESRACWNDPDIDPRYATAAPPVQPTTTVPTTDPDGETTTVPDGETTTTVEGEPTTTVPTTDTTVEGTETTVEEETTTTTVPPEGEEPTTTTTTSTEP